MTWYIRVRIIMSFMQVISRYSSYYGFFNSFYSLNYCNRMHVRLQFIITTVAVPS